MNRRFLPLFIAAYLLAGGTSVAKESRAVERLLDLLQQKGILSAAEVAAVRSELEAELSAACAPAAVPRAEAAASPEAQVATVPATAPATPPPPEHHLVTLGPATVGGDFRLRFDLQGRDFGGGAFDWERQRGRFRLRLGVAFQPSEQVEVGFRLASGSGVQNSTNQTFGEYGRAKHIFIDRAYAVWRPNRHLSFTGGRCANPLDTGSLVWDADVNWEGLAARFTWPAETGEVYVQAAGFFLDDVKSGDLAQPFLVAYQAGAQKTLGRSLTLAAAVAKYDFINLDAYRVEDLADPESFVGYNHRHGQQMLFDSSGRLLNRFDPIEFRIELGVRKWARAPVTFFGHVISNLSADLAAWLQDAAANSAGDPAALRVYGGEDRSLGYQLGVELGRSREAKHLFGGYFYQVLEDYAFPAVFSDSDFYDGYPNNRGHALRIGYNLSRSVAFVNNIYLVQREDAAKDGVRSDRRWLADLMIRF